MVEYVLWPAYLDANYSRSEGRRVAEDLAVEEPTLEEIAEAVGQVGYDAVIEREQAYSREPFEDRGRVLVQGAEDSSKNDVIQAVAAYVNALRS